MSEFLSVDTAIVNGGQNNNKMPILINDATIGKDLRPFNKTPN